MEQPWRARRGGIRQRLEANSVATPPKIESALANFLLKEYAWGAMSPQLVQKIADFAMTDLKHALATGGFLKDLDTLSKLGGAGKQSNNMHRDIMQFQSCSNLPSGLEVQMPFKDVGLQLQEVMLPHEMFAAVYHKYPQSWQKVIMPNAEKLEFFWEAQENHPNMNGNPIRERLDLSTKCVPIAFHGDEVPITGKGKCWCKSMLTFEWCSLLGSGVTCDRMFWVWGAFDKMIDDDLVAGTMVHFWKVLSWSFFWLQQGKWPTADWHGNTYPVDSVEGQKAGKHLADGYYATLWSVIGDLDYLSKTLGLPRSTSHNPCCLCKCTLNGELSWKNNSTDAPWLGAMWTPLEWIAWDQKAKCELFSIPGVSSQTVALDWMRNKYLGIDQYQYGSVLYVLCYMVLLDQPKQNLATCWAHIKEFYRSHKTSNRYQSISKLSMFVRKGGTIKLRGKAGELRGLGPALLDLWQSHMNPALAIHSKVHLMLKLNLKLENLLEFHNDEVNLPVASARKCVEYAFAMRDAIRNQ